MQVTRSSLQNRYHPQRFIIVISTDSFIPIIPFHQNCLSLFFCILQIPFTPYSVMYVCSPCHMTLSLSYIPSEFYISSHSFTQIQNPSRTPSIHIVDVLPHICLTSIGLSSCAHLPYALPIGAAKASVNERVEGRV